MTERGMIFNAEMVRAILEGRKTQTRRPVKFPVHDKNLGCELSGNELAGELSAGNYLNSAFGKPGDRIWVREAYRFPASLDDVSPTGVGEMAVATGYRKPWAPTFYEFTGTFSDGWKGFETPPKVSDAGKLRPSIHMPRWASRILLEITDVRVERLNAINEHDAQAEGVAKLRGGFWKHYQPGWTQHQLSARGSFVTLWKSIYGDESWNSNPWVWVIAFERVEGGAA
ncbi:morphogenetic protein [Klebsiella quasipneumoniae subsp. similipneumoniae]|uniref:morphogenetic protein n=1 Tax=Klebsiella quasipneumoniae TaxID=1463165 RepID=UPI0038D04018